MKRRPPEPPECPTCRDHKMARVPAHEPAMSRLRDGTETPVRRLTFLRIPCPNCTKGIRVQ